MKIIKSIILLLFLYKAESKIVTVASEIRGGEFYFKFDPPLKNTSEIALKSWHFIKNWFYVDRPKKLSVRRYNLDKVNNHLGKFLPYTEIIQPKYIPEYNEIIQPKFLSGFNFASTSSFAHKLGDYVLNIKIPKGQFILESPEIQPLFLYDEKYKEIYLRLGYHNNDILAPIFEKSIYHMFNLPFKYYVDRIEKQIRIIAKIYQEYSLQNRLNDFNPQRYLNFNFTYAYFDLSGASRILALKSNEVQGELLDFIPVFNKNFGDVIMGENDDLSFKKLKTSVLSSLFIKFYSSRSYNVNNERPINFKFGDALLTFVIKQHNYTDINEINIKGPAPQLLESDLT